MAYDAREIANFILDYADQKNMPVTNLSLLKFLYFAHGWYLAKHNAPLIENDFEAWQYGPVIRVVYSEFSEMGSLPIAHRAMKFDPVTQTKSVANYQFDAATKDFIRAIFDAYSRYSAYELSDLTHERGSPWEIAWNGRKKRVNPGMKIENSDIRDHFIRKMSSGMRQ